jgi:hypothetical protein
MRAVATKVNAEWATAGTGVRAHFIDDYYTKSGADQRRYLTDSLKVPQADIGSHAGMLDTSELLFINSTYIRTGKLGRGTAESGHSGDAGKATRELGQKFLQIKIDNAVNQIKASIAAPGGTN